MPPRRETSRVVLNYLRALKEKEYPHFLIAKWLVDDAESYYKARSHEEVIYTLNPRWLHREMNEEMKHEKLTVKTISRVVRGFLAAKKLHYYTTTTSGGCKTYHVELNPQVMKKLRTTDHKQPREE